MRRHIKTYTLVRDIRYIYVLVLTSKMGTSVIRESTVYDWFRRILEANQRIFHDSSVIHVSEVTTCLRKSWYTRKSPVKATDTVNIIMSIGNGVHSLLQEYLASKGWKSEVKVEWNFKKFKLVGHIDLYHPEENIVIELKTTGKKPGKPYHSHVMQLNAYLRMISADKGYIIYISRDGHVKVFQHNFSKRLWDKTIKRAFYLWHTLNENKIPKPEPSFLCNYCPFKWRCIAQKAEVVKADEEREP